MNQENDVGNRQVASMSDEVRRIMDSRHGALGRMIDRMAPLLTYVWAIALGVGWGMGMTAAALLRMTLGLLFMWAYALEHAQATEVIRYTQAIARDGHVSPRHQSSPSTTQRAAPTVSRKVSEAANWVMVVLALFALGGLLIAVRVEQRARLSESCTDVVVAASPIASGSPLSVTNMAWCKMPDSFLTNHTGSAYVPARYAYVLLGHSIITPVKYAQLIQWTNTDIVISAAQPTARTNSVTGRQ